MTSVNLCVFSPLLLRAQVIGFRALPKSKMILSQRPSHTCKDLISKEDHFKGPERGEERGGVGDVAEPTPYLINTHT